MDALKKTIKKLNEEEYAGLLTKMGIGKDSKPYQVMEMARNKNFDDTEMIDHLQVNPSTYYTLKSRLRAKIASVLSKEVDNPISVLMDEVARVPANLYGPNKEVSIRALKDLEKQLLEYDLSNELIIVYKTLAQLNLYTYDYEYYTKLYNKYVAYSLAVSKAENLFYDFVKKIGQYQLTGSPQNLEAVSALERELSNICELYGSHRLYVYYNIVRIYYLCIVPEMINELKKKEMEIDSILIEIKKIFDKYQLDTFYQNIKFVVDFLYFTYYLRTGSIVRAEHYYKKANEKVADVSQKHILNFYVVQMLNSKLELYNHTGNLNELIVLNENIESDLDIDKNETYHFLAVKKFLAACKFYEGDFQKAARLMNDLRNEMSLKQYPLMDMECKLFQAMQYCMMGDDELYIQIINSIKRQISDDEPSHEQIKIFIKLLNAGMKPTDFKKKVEKISQLWSQFKEAQLVEYPILSFVKLDDKMIKKLADPYKN